MNKSWIKLKDRLSMEYREGVESFMEFAEKNATLGVDMLCPCMECINLERQPARVIRFHLHRYGITPRYEIWREHGETVEREQTFDTSNEHDFDMFNLMQDANINGEDVRRDGDDDDDDGEDELNDLVEDIYMGTYENDDFGVNLDGTDGDSMNNFFNLLDDVQREVYPGCTRFTILSFVIKFFHMKVLFKWSDNSFNELLKILKKLLPECDKKVPFSLYEAKKFLRDIGLGYVVIHACKYDCALFWKENANLNECPVCKEPRYCIDDETGKKVPHKVLRYFPITPRLKRLFMSRKTATDMRWHKEKRVNDGILRHPADGEEWKEFDRRHHHFATESRNVRLGLASDGFNPFGDKYNTQSLWPVIVTPYNLPPWKCMKEPYCMMSLLIPGPSAPGRDIDIYMRPFIDELKMLWEVGVAAYDATDGQNFRMRAAVMWTINDFPAYANLSGWSTKGYLACPVCNKDSSSQRLTDKIGYTGARRFLPNNHPWRKSKLFNGKAERGLRPADLSGVQILEQLDSGTFPPFGKNPKILKKQKKENIVLNWKKKSIFWELPYWKTLKLRHNLDVMHIEKNICDNLLSTLLSLEKNKDTDKARLDLENLGIRKELHLKERENGSGFTKPSAPFTLSMQQRKSFCEFLNSVKYPDGYAANIAKCSNSKDGKVSGLKSHDCHILLQRLLPIGMRGYLDNEICIALFELGNFFQQICSKTLKVSDLEKLEENIILVLCKLEKIFPPAFFDVMVHLAIHLPREVLLGGPVHFRWMYPIERLLGIFKGFVANRAHPEGSIAERYIDKECTTFCSMYLGGIQTAFNREERNEDSGDHSDVGLTAFAQAVRTFGEIVRGFNVSPEQQDEAHWFVLNNSVEVEQYLKKHESRLQNQGSDNINKRQRKEFPQWFKQHMNQLRSQHSHEATDEMWSLATGPNPIVNLYSACIFNGVRFLTRDRDNRRKSQNCGIFVMGNHQGKMHEFYGFLSKVWELNYMFGHKVCLFQCEWFNTGSSTTYRTDLHVTTIDMRSRWYRNDPFVFPSQVQQAKEDQVQPKFSDFYKLSHIYKKKEGWINQRCEEDYAAIQQLENESLVNGEELISPEEASQQVFGKKNYLKGLGPSMKMSFKKKFSGKGNGLVSDEFHTLNAEVETLRDVHQEYKDKLVSQDAMIKSQGDMIEAQNKKIEDLGNRYKRLTNFILAGGSLSDENFSQDNNSN